MGIFVEAQKVGNMSDLAQICIKMRSTGYFLHHFPLLPHLTDGNINLDPSYICIDHLFIIFMFSFTEIPWVGPLNILKYHKNAK